MPERSDNRNGPRPTAELNGLRRPWWARWFGGRDPGAVEAASWARLSMQVRLDLGETGRGISLMLTTPVTAGDLVPMMTLEFAHHLASEEGLRVLIADAHFSDSWASRFFGGPEAPGLIDALREPAGKLRGLVIPTAHERVDFLPAGDRRAGLGGALVPSSIQAFLDRAHKEFDVTLLPCPPILEDSSSLVFPALADCVLLLSVEGETRRQKLNKSRQVLESARAKRVGLVLAAPRNRRGLRLK